MLRHLSKDGFTLIELIIVVAIIGLLAAAAFVAVDPAKRIGKANDATRWSDVTAIADAIMKYTVDNNGSLPSGVSSASADTEYMIHIEGGTASGTDVCTSTGNTDSELDISSGLVSEYIATMPLDPNVAASAAELTGIGYYFEKDANGRIKVGACIESAYAAASIYVQR
jgi:prepilin-type N-terminal cleavage/methylation domain-containing protein